MKKILVSTMCLFINVWNALAYEPSGRGYDPDAPDLGLPSGNEVGIGLLIAIVAIPLGYAILNACKGNSGESSPVSFIGVILICGGIVCLLPTIAWLFAIGSVIMGVGIAVMFLFGIIVLFANKGK